MIQLTVVLFGLLTLLTQVKAITEPESAFESATKKLQEGDNQGAIDAYQTLIEEGWHAPELYLNLAIAFDRLNQPNQALAQAYRSWLLVPHSPTYRAGFLSLAEKADLQSSRVTQLQWAVHAMRWQLPLAIIASLLFWLAAICLFGWRHRPAALTIGVLCLAFAVMTTTGSFVLNTKRPSIDTAWVIDESPLLASHAEGAPKVGNLLPLEEIRVQVERDNWANVTASRQRSGWMRINSIVTLFPWQP